MVFCLQGGLGGIKARGSRRQQGRALLTADRVDNADGAEALVELWHCGIGGEGALKVQ